MSDRKTALRSMRWRARIILLTGAGLGTMAIMADRPVSLKPCVWTPWASGVATMRRRALPGWCDEPRRGASRQMPPCHRPSRRSEILALTLEEAAAQRGHPLEPWGHRWRKASRRLAPSARCSGSGARFGSAAPSLGDLFKLSNDPGFVPRKSAISSASIWTPPAHAVVLSCG